MVWPILSGTCPPPQAACQPSCAQPYQPLPISTGAVGLDRCGNIEAYAAPRVVRRPVCWPYWPIQPSLPGWSNAAVSWDSGPGSPGFGTSGLEALFRGGATAASWLLASRAQSRRRQR